MNVITLPVHFPTSSKSLPSIYHNFSFGDLVLRHILCISYHIFFFLLVTWFTMYISNAKSFIFFSLTKEIFTIKCTNTVRFLCQLETYNERRLKLESESSNCCRSLLGSWHAESQAATATVTLICLNEQINKKISL